MPSFHVQQCEVLVSFSDWLLGTFIEWHASFKAVIQFYVERRTDRHTQFFMYSLNCRRLTKFKIVF